MIPKPVRSLFTQPRYQPRHAMPRPQPAPLFDHPLASHAETWAAYPQPERDSQPRTVGGHDTQGGQT